MTEPAVNTIAFINVGALHTRRVAGTAAPAPSGPCVAPGKAPRITAEQQYGLSLRLPAEAAA